MHVVKCSNMILVLFVLFCRIEWNRLRAINPTDSSFIANDSNEIYCGSKPRPQMYFTVSSLANTSASGEITQRLLELNWYNINNGSGDVVAIFDHDPTESTSDPIDSQRVDPLTDGFFRSNVQFPVITFDGSNLTSDCLGYWGAYLKSGRSLLAVTCVRARPFWMSDIRKYIGKSNLTSLMIPGTHDSGSYSPYQGRKSENVVDRYMFSQDDDIFTQFCFGIRHVDLRVAHYTTSKEKFWINHSFFRTNNPLSKVIDAVKRFLSATKDEILILDFHRFPVGFKNDSIHGELMQTLVTELGPWMIPNRMGYSATVDEILDSGKRVLVAYYSRARLGHELFWPEVKQKWGDEQEKDDLKAYFQRVFASRIPSMLWAAMAELTPTSASIFLRPKEGLRFLADKINRDVSAWFRGDWGNVANIVATDFYLGNHVVETAIEINSKKTACGGSQTRNNV